LPESDGLVLAVTLSVKPGWEGVKEKVQYVNTCLPSPSGRQELTWQKRITMGMRSGFGIKLAARVNYIRYN
jgi:hypothetical protein